MRIAKMLAVALPLLLLLACAFERHDELGSVNPVETERQETLKGDVFYVDRRALSDQAELIVELSASDQTGTRVPPLSRALQGQQVPIAFELPLPSTLKRSIPVRLRAAIVEPGGPVRIGSSAEFTLADTVDIGQLPLNFLADDDYQAAYRCGETLVQQLSIGERLIVSLDGEPHILSAAEAASGARYRGDSVELWTHQGRARLTVEGREFPECRPVDHANGGAGTLVDSD